QSRDVQQQLEHLLERIRDEYQFELTEAVAAGATSLPIAKPAAGNEPPMETAAEKEDAAPPVDAPAVDHGAHRAEVEEKIDRLRRKLKALGNINTDSLRDLDEMEARYARLSTQLSDLVEAKTALEEIVRRINSESKRMFTETFAEIRKHFQELFRKLFGGG